MFIGFKAIESLQESFVHHIIESRQNTQSDDLVLIRDLKRQINERDLTLSSIQQTLTVVEKERDEALIAKDVLVASHQTEICVSPIGIPCCVLELNSVAVCCLCLLFRG